MISCVVRSTLKSMKSLRFLRVSRLWLTRELDNYLLCSDLAFKTYCFAWWFLYCVVWVKKQVHRSLKVEYINKQEILSKSYIPRSFEKNFVFFVGKESQRKKQLRINLKFDEYDEYEQLTTFNQWTLIFCVEDWL